MPPELNADRRHRVLLVESDPGDAELVQIWLRRARETRYEIWHVETLGDAEGCLAKADFELALLDLSLPDAMGPWAYQALHERHPDLPVIVFSSFAEAHVGARLLEEGAQDHLVKGQMSGDTLIRSMRHGIERGRLARELRACQSEAREAGWLRSELVAELAQEIRTPLLTVLGMADLLSETELTREQEGYVRSFKRSSETLLSRLDGLLGAERTEASEPSGGRLVAEGAGVDGVLRVLVVDDDPRTLARSLDVLRGAGHAAERACDGRLAVEMFREDDYDLVLMDMQMPGMDGFDATRAIRRFEAESGRTAVPVLAVTGLADPSQVGACLAAGCDEHLLKPVPPEDLLAAVARHTPKHHGRLLRVDGATVDEIDLYLHERHNDLAALRLALDARDFDAIETVGLELERSAASRGFDQLAALGDRLQAGARERDGEALARCAADLTDFLREVKIVVG